jgi:hypothetical protein
LLGATWFHIRRASLLPANGSWFERGWLAEAIWRQPPLDILVNNAAIFIAQSERLSFRRGGCDPSVPVLTSYPVVAGALRMSEPKGSAMAGTPPGAAETAELSGPQRASERRWTRRFRVCENYFPLRDLPVIHRDLDHSVSGHLPVTKLREQIWR